MENTLIDLRNKQTKKNNSLACVFASLVVLGQKGIGGFNLL